LNEVLDIYIYMSTSSLKLNHVKCLI